MAKLEWGTKRTCLSCGKKFYDLRRVPITCPSCETVLELNAPGRGARRSRAAAAAPVLEAVAEAPVRKAPPVEPNEPELEDNDVEDSELDDIETDDIDTEEKEDDDIIEDASELGEDDDDMAEVIDGMEDDKEDG